MVPSTSTSVRDDERVMGLEPGRGVVALERIMPQAVTNFVGEKKGRQSDRGVGVMQCECARLCD